MNQIQYIIHKNIMLILSVFLLLALIIGKVDLITGILIHCMWFIFGFISFQRGYEQKVDEEMTLYYRQKIDKEYNKINNEISNN
jgi:Ca2+/Na+ antiporter